MEAEGRLFDLFDEIPGPDKRDLLVGVALLGNLYLAYQEQRKTREERRQQSEELKSVSQALAGLQEQMASQARLFQEKQAEWQEERESYEAELKNARGALEETALEFEAAQRDLEEKNRRLAEAERRFAGLEASHQEDRNAMETRHQAELAEMEERHASEGERIRLEDRTAMEKAMEEYQEIRGDWDLYHRYRAWMQENRSRICLNGLDCGSFCDFIACCGQRWTLGYVFRELARLDPWAWESEDVGLLNELIDCCCRLQKLQRLRPEGIYDPSLHYKPRNGPANGYITRVLLDGVAESGSVLEDCKPFVMLD